MEEEGGGIIAQWMCGFCHYKGSSGDFPAAYTVSQHTKGRKCPYCGRVLIGKELMR